MCVSTEEKGRKTHTKLNWIGDRRVVHFTLWIFLLFKLLHSVLMRWMKLEPIIQSEVSQKEKHQYSILTHIYGI